MKSVITTMTRAGAHGTTSLLTRAAMTLLLAFLTLTALAQTEGPWTFYGSRSGQCAVSAAPSICYNGLDNSHWGNMWGWCDGRGLGNSFTGTAPSSNKTGVFTLCTRTESVPSYTRIRVNWNYTLEMWNDTFWQHMAVYACTNTETLKATDLDFTRPHSNNAGSQYYLHHIYQNWTDHNCSGSFSNSFDFDNRNSSSAQNKTWALMMTHVMDNTGGSHGFSAEAWFKTNSWSRDTYYYLYVTFDANGGNGSMSQQTIDNSGTLQVEY